MCISINIYSFSFLKISFPGNEYHIHDRISTYTPQLKVNVSCNIQLKYGYEGYRLRTSIYFTVLYHIASRAANNSMRQFGN